MTCKDKITQEKPQCIWPQQPGGVFGCPHMHGLLPKPSWCNDRFQLGPCICEACWNRELEED